MQLRNIRRSDFDSITFGGTKKKKKGIVILALGIYNALEDLILFFKTFSCQQN